MTVASATPRQWTQHDILVVEQTAERTWAAVERARAEEALHQSKEKYRTLFENMGQGYALGEVIRDAQGHAIDLRYLELNPAFERLSGIPVAQAQGRTVREVYGTVEPEWFAVADRVARLKVPERVEYEIGAIGRWFQMHFYPAEGDRYMGLYEDVTDRKRQEQRKEFMLTLSDALRSLTHPAAIQAATTQLLRAHFDTARSYYMEIDEEKHLAYMRAENRRDATPSAIGVYDLHLYEGVIAQIRTGKPLIINDWDERTKADLKIGHEGTESMNQRQVVAQIAAPIIKHGKLVGTLTVNDSRPRAWTENEVELVVETAERTWAAVERAKAEEAQRLSEERLQQALTSAPMFWWEMDLATGLATTSENYGEVLGFAQTERPADGLAAIAKLVVEDDAPILSAALQRTIRGEGDFWVTYRMTHPQTGAIIWVQSSGRFVASPANGPGKVVGICLNITDRKRAEEALQLADRRKDEFLAMLAHELRNPMSTIRSGLHILSLTDGNDETSRTTVSMMNRQTDHLVRMVDDLLDVSRISQGKIQLHTGRVNLVEVVGQAVESMRALFADQGRRLHIHLPRAPIYVEGDATRLSQVVSNLLTNGVRYTGEGGQVWLKLEHNQGEAMLEVGDNGIGLAADQLSAIFELFVQVDNSTARSKGGLGLGLTLVKRLVEMHDGRVDAQSAGINKGSTFRVHLPTQEPAPVAKPSPAPAQVSSSRILIIDDNVDAALTLAMLLKLKGYETHTRHSGRAGLEAAESLHPAVILLDLGMPGMDGYETCHRLRQQPWGGQVPVIALSGYGQEEDRQRTKAAGFTAHLVKPVDLDALLSLLAKSLSNPKAN